MSASERSAALLAEREPGRFACDSVGTQRLRNGFDPCPLDRLHRIEDE
ncbi:MAG: hypothetical protein K2W96_14435 [Gemmataceae bacterium]|nr:hypothetical protein [Gemmataceae bacterium]